MPARRTQEERRTTHPGLIVQAMIECLNEYGYSGATYARVAERAGVSRGALLHYFPDKVELAVAAADHVRQDGVARIDARIPTLPEGAGRTVAASTCCREIFGGPLFHAALEVWLRGRTEQPWATGWPRSGRRPSRTWQSVLPVLFGAAPGGVVSDLPELARLLAATLRGLGAGRPIRGRPARDLGLRARPARRRCSPIDRTAVRYV